MMRTIKFAAPSLILALALTASAQTTRPATTQSAAIRPGATSQSTTQSTTRMAFNNDSPKALLEWLQNSAVVDDYATMAQAVEPKYQEALNRKLVTRQKLNIQRDSLVQTMVEKFGKAPAAKLLDGSGPFRPDGKWTPLDRVMTPEGKILWDRITITEEGDTATWRIDDLPPSTFKKIDGKWYVSLDRTERTIDEIEPEMVKAAKINGLEEKAFAKIEEGVRSGAITAEDFNEEYEQIIRAMGESDEFAAAIRPAARPTSRPTTTRATSQATSQPATQVTIDQSSPKALLEGLHNASLADDFGSIIRATDPEFQAGMIRMLGSYKMLQVRQSSMKAAMAEKFGPELAAKLLKENGTMGVDVKLDTLGKAVSPEGKILWKKIIIREEGDTADISVVGGSPLFFKKIDGKWYTSATGSGKAAADATDQYVASFEQSSRMMAKLDEGIRSGVVTPANFRDKSVQAFAQADPAAGPAITTRATSRPATTQPAGPVTIDQSSPQSLLEGMHDAAMADDLDSLVQVMEPDYRLEMGRLVAAVQKMQARRNSMKKTIAEKLGEEPVARLLKEGGLMGSDAKMTPLRSAVSPDGEILWEQITIKEEGDKANIDIAGVPYTFKKIDGKWYACPTGQSATPEMLEWNLLSAEKLVVTMEKLMAKMEEGVRSGEVTPENFQEKSVQAMRAMFEGADNAPATSQASTAPSK